MRRGALLAQAARSRRGMALMVVLLVLLALLVLCTPFLFSARDADRASTQHADRVEARLALDAAARHARHVLAQSYSSADLDRTPWSDTEEELAVDNQFDAAFLNANDPRGPMWDLEVRDTSGAIDLDSASPHVIANLLGLVARTASIVEGTNKPIPFAGGANFAPAGFVTIDGELVRYSALEDGSVTGLTRGVLGPGEGEEWQGGPRAASGHGIGTNIVDQRAYAPALWRLREKGAWRPFDAPQQLADVGRFAMAAAVDPRAAGVVDATMVQQLLEHGSVHADARGVATWQRAVRVTTPIEGGKTGRLRVQDARFVNAGSTVRIGDGAVQELALVQQVLRNGEIVLDRVLEGTWPAFGSVLEVLARRPVNANTASEATLTALYLNLQLAGRNSRVTLDEAKLLAEVTVASRPFTGHEDWLKRVLLPAAGLEKLPSDSAVIPDALLSGKGFLDAADAVAVYANALNANDAALAWATLPLSFVSRDVYDLELRASANAPSGAARAMVVREETVVVAPQRELTRLWGRQEDFDEEQRLALSAPLWATGPRSTTRFDGGTATPSRLWPNWGVKDGAVLVPGSNALPDGSEMLGAERVFAAREDESWIQLQPIRELDTAARQGRTLHFDQESRDLEGRWLPDLSVKLSSDDNLVRWTTSASPLARPLAWSGWIKPRSAGDGLLVDLAGSETSVERVQLLLEGADLVLRVLDGFGDHRDTTFKEAGEVRYALAGGGSAGSSTAGPGLPYDTWHHVWFEVRGNRPSQMTMLVNGQAFGVRTLGLTRLSQSLSQGAGVIAVDSLEGFPAQCVVRIGNELIEVLNDGTSLKAERQLTGTLAGFGGRLAREPYAALVEGGTANIPANFAGIQTTHPAGTPVELYGYALQTLSDVPTGRVDLAQDLGRFRVAMLEGVVGASSPLGDPIVLPVGLFGITLGDGILSNSTATGLVLRCADDGDDTGNATPASEYMSAFSPSGGYAAIVQTLISAQTGQAQDANGAAIGGIEIVRYSGWNDRTLSIAQRGLGAPTLPNIANLQGNQAARIGGQRSFVAQWNPNIVVGGGAGQPAVTVQTQLRWRCYVVPISLPVPGAGTVNGFLSATAQNPQLAQITHLQDAEYTEWVRYDHFDSTNGQLVRDEPAALNRVYDVIVSGGDVAVQVPTTPGGGGGGGGPGGGPVSPPSSNTVVKTPVQKAAAQQSAGAQSGGFQWDPRQGVAENTVADHPISRAVEAHFRFRGVLGTYSHLHPAGTRILPVIAMPPAGPDQGRPGRRDAIFLSGPTPDHPGWPLLVHRAYQAAPLVGTSAWEQPVNAIRPAGIENPQGGPVQEDPGLLNRTWVAFEDRSPEPFVATTQQQQQQGQSSTVANVETRLLTRIASFPSGERPRLVSGVALGGAANGLTGVVPGVTVDEVIFGDHQFGRSTPNVDPEAAAGASLVLIQSISEDDTTILVAPTAVRTTFGVLGGTHEFLNDLPQAGGLLKIGDEIVGYSQLDASTGTITVASNGRGLLGTDPGPHSASEPIAFLEHMVVSTLGGGIGALDATLPLAATDAFPPEGLVLIGEELLHYTRIVSGALEMPRASQQPGLRDERGSGLFRGRFGTTPSAHSAGEMVILFPARYPDRWADKADAPELSYHSFAVDHPAAYWTGVFYAEAQADGVRLRALQKTDAQAPWDLDPQEDPRVKLLQRGNLNESAVPVMAQSDRAEWRVHAVYDQRAFDPVAGLSHGWKRTPKLRLFSVFYYAPSTTLRSMER